MTYYALTEARARLLLANELDEAKLFRLLESSLGAGADYADLYFQHKYTEHWSLEDGVVKRGNFGVDQGVGGRALTGERSALAFSDDLSIASVERVVRITQDVAKATGYARIDARLRRYAQPAPTRLYASDNPILTHDAACKVEILQRVDARARGRDPRVRHVQASLSASYEVVLVVGSDGRLVADLRPQVNLSVQVVVHSDGRRGMAHAGLGGRYDYGRLTDAKLFAAVDHAVDSALRQLEAIDAPVGAMTVVCGPGWPGILLHEAVGHGLEGDFNCKGTSAFAGRVGERVAAPGVTIVDDGTLPDLRGSLSVDDEGNLGACTTLIEDGYLRGFMHDDLSARLLGVPATGNGRRQSYAHEPLPRMTNTYMRNGDCDPLDIVRSVERGIYATDFSGGQVDITSGRFTFAATGAYLIENGRITAPIKGATLIGNGPEALKHVSMIGNDLALDDGIASCGKDGQTVAVGVGQPTIRIDSMTVGGSA